MQNGPSPTFSPRSRLGPLIPIACNNFMRDWRHEFIYDEATLTVLASEADISDVREVNANEDPALAGLEQWHLVIGDKMNDF